MASEADGDRQTSVLVLSTQYHRMPWTTQSQNLSLDLVAVVVLLGTVLNFLFGRASSIFGVIHPQRFKQARIGTVDSGSDSVLPGQPNKVWVKTNGSRGATWSARSDALAIREKAISLY